MAYEGQIAETVVINGHNGDEIDAYYARPLGAGPYPGVVVIHHAPGWDLWTREVTRTFAQQGYAAIAPHLYHRSGPGTPDEIATVARAAGGVPDAQMIGDVAGAMAYMRRQNYANGKVGVIGFCSGGRHTFVCATNLPDVDAAVDCWGGGVIPQDPSQITERRPSAIEKAANLACPMLGIFGNDDANPDPNQVNETEEILKKLGKTIEFHRYDGAGHAFLAAERPSYRAEQAADAWAKVFEFYGRHLSTPVAAAAGAR
jgi:carboxymethylenebutenolidase